MSEKAAKRQRAGRTQQAVTPQVGIVYLVDDKLWIDATPLARVGHFCDLAFHELAHEQYWRQLVNKGVAPDTEYTEFPRGRVSYDRRSGQFTLLADLCILRQKNLVSAILSRMHLPIRRTKTGTDGGYRCGVCVRSEPLSL